MTGLTDKELRELAPSVFTTKKSKKVSNKYSFIPTINIIKDMRKLGWNVFNATQQKSRNVNDLAHTKHMVRLRNSNIGLINDSVPEIVLTNSHDGRNAFKLHAGIFRMVCSNGMVIADTTIDNIRIKHQWYDFDDIKVITDAMVNKVPEMIKKMNSLNNVILSDEEQVEFAKKAILTRWPKGNESVNVEDLLSPTRKADRGDDLWRIFNVIQEKLVKGGLVFNNKKEKMQKIRPVTNIDRQVTMNKDLWELTEAYV
jgi:uncharacterized protein YfkK (UPF0435 family)